MTCWKCRHSREIARLTEEQARLRKICSKCRLGEDLAGDGSVSLDTIHDGTIARIANVAPNAPTSYTYDPAEIDEPQQEPDAETRTKDALTTLLACVAALPYEQIGRLAQLAEVFQSLTRSIPRLLQRKPAARLSLPLHLLPLRLRPPAPRSIPNLPVLRRKQPRKAMSIKTKSICARVPVPIMIL